MNSPAHPFHAGAPLTPTFGRMPTDVPFMMQMPAPSIPHPDPWVPPTQPYLEIPDVDMAEAGPPQRSTPAESEEEGEPRVERKVAVGALRRVYNARKKMRDGRRPVARTASVQDADESEAESESEHDGITPVTQNTSNHYTLNLSNAAAPRSDMPYVLLGCVICH